MYSINYSALTERSFERNFRVHSKSRTRFLAFVLTYRMKVNVISPNEDVVINKAHSQSNYLHQMHVKAWELFIVFSPSSLLLSPKQSPSLVTGTFSVGMLDQPDAIEGFATKSTWDESFSHTNQHVVRSFELQFPKQRRVENFLPEILPHNDVVE